MVLGAKENVLYELAQAMATNDGQSAAVALRKLAQAGYGSLDEVDSTSDWTLLSIPGLGVGRLGAIRRLTRLDWQPPSPQAVKAINRFVSAARLALRFWSLEALLDVITGSPPRVSKDQLAAKRLALDLFGDAAHRALCHCSSEELTEALSHAGHACRGIRWRAANSSEERDQEPENGQIGSPVERIELRYIETNADRNSEHFAFPPHKRREIVQHYRAARESGHMTNKDAWAGKNYGISGRTLLRYEREYEQAEAEMQ